MNKETLDANKYFDSGLYETVFYTKHRRLEINEGGIIEEIEYNKDLLTKVWKEDEDLEGTKYEIEDMVTALFWEKLSYWTVYFEPLIFNEQIALECGLTPFTYKGLNLLALSGCGMNLSPKLDAYQVLTQGRIDRNSEFFSVNNQEYFECVVGKGIMDKMNTILKGGK